MKIYFLSFALLLLTSGLLFAQESDEEAALTTSVQEPSNLGFQVDLIEVLNGDVELTDQFDAGISGINDSHKTNYEQCKVYNLELDETDDVDESDADAAGEEDLANDDLDVDDLLLLLDGVATDATTDTIDEEEVESCVLDDTWPVVRIHWSVDDSLVDIGYDWTVKIGGCSGSEMLENDDDCILLTESAQSLSKNGNEIDIPLPKLIATLRLEEVAENDSRVCCSAFKDEVGSVKLYFFTGFENDTASVAYDVVQFDYDYKAPGTPTGVQILEQGETLTVSWLGVEQGTENLSYSVYYSEEPYSDFVDATEVDAGDSLSVQLTGLEKGVPVYIRVGAKDDFDNVGPLSSMYLATPKETLDGWEHYKASGGGEDGGFCFIATAAYGSYMAPHVQTLRHFRDQVLLPTDWGTAFVGFYYREGRQWASWIVERRWARSITRMALVPLILFAWFVLYLSPLAQLAVLLSIYGLFRSLKTHLRRRYPAGRHPGLLFRM